MKKLIVFVMALLIPLSAQAYVFIDVPFTGLSAEKTDNPGGLWNPYSSTSYMGGPAGTNSLGMAYQFSLNRAYNIDYLSVDALARSYFSDDIDELSFDFNLYKGSVAYRDSGLYIPDTRHLLLSSTASFQDNGAADRIYDDYLISFDRTLTPGTYWLAREAPQSGGPLIVDGITTRFARVHNPEATTLLTLAGGLLGLWRWRRRA